MTLASSSSIERKYIPSFVQLYNELSGSIFSESPYGDVTKFPISLTDIKLQKFGVYPHK
jgi:hypothetical protein